MPIVNEPKYSVGDRIVKDEREWLILDIDRACKTETTTANKIDNSRYLARVEKSPRDEWVGVEIYISCSLFDDEARFARK